MFLAIFSGVPRKKTLFGIFFKNLSPLSLNFSIIFSLFSIYWSYLACSEQWHGIFGPSESGKPQFFFCGFSVTEFYHRYFVELWYIRRLWTRFKVMKNWHGAHLYFHKLQFIGSNTYSSIRWYFRSSTIFCLFICNISRLGSIATLYFCHYP